LSSSSSSVISSYQFLNTYQAVHHSLFFFLLFCCSSSYQFLTTYQPAVNSSLFFFLFFLCPLLLPISYYLPTRNPSLSICLPPFPLSSPLTNFLVLTNLQSTPLYLSSSSSSVFFSYQFLTTCQPAFLQSLFFFLLFLCLLLLPISYYLPTRIPPVSICLPPLPLSSSPTNFSLLSSYQPAVHSSLYFFLLFLYLLLPISNYLPTRSPSLSICLPPILLCRRMHGTESRQIMTPLVNFTYRGSTPWY
jgi:hypothetical protein